MSHLLYILLSTEEPTTFAIGVYSDKQSAFRHFVALLRTQRGFGKLSRKFLDECGYSLRDLSETRMMDLLMDGPEDETDFFDLHLNYVIESVKPGTLFDFSGWTSWQEKNLYNLLRMIHENRIGPLDTSWPYADAYLFLR